MSWRYSLTPTTRAHSSDDNEVLFATFDTAVLRRQLDLVWHSGKVPIRKPTKDSEIV